MRLPPTLAIPLALLGCNEAPLAGVVSITPAGATTTDALVVVFDEPVFDKNDDALTLTWTWRRNGAVVEDLTTDRVPAERTARADLWEVEVAAADEKASTEVMSASITIANAPPAVSLSGLPATATTEQGLEVQADVQDADGDTLDIAYAWSVDGALTAWEGATLPAEATAKGQVWEVEVTVADQDGPGASERLATTIVNTPPSVARARVAPDEVYEDTVVTCIREGWQDVDGDAEGANITWLVNGSEVAAGPELTGASFDKGDAVACRAEPDDGQDVGEAVRSEAVTVRNSPPFVESATLPLDPVRTEDTVGVTVGGLVDADGDEVTLTWAWTVNGVPAGSDATLPAETHVRGDTLGVTLVPHDGEEDGVPYVVDEVTVANTPPVVVSGGITPGVAYTNDVLGLEMELVDADGDEVSVAVSWSVDGSVVGSGMTLDGATWFDKNETVIATLTPDDGLDAGVAYTTAGVAISNSPPSEPVVVVDPKYPLEGEQLDCLIDADSTDADGDAITYSGRWTVDGSAYTSATTTDFAGDTVPSAVTVDEEAWSCFVTASDGTDSSAEVQADAGEIGLWPGTLTFTNCGATGQSGPSQAACDSAYAGTSLEGLVTLSSGKQQVTLPADGTYRIEAWGAQGRSAEPGRSGGRGARMRGDFALSEGEVLTIVVGQEGSDDGCNGGGGGGSAVYGGILYLVAGGGGGTRALVDQDGCDASTSWLGGTGSGMATTHSCGLKAYGTVASGGSPSVSRWGSGGGAAWAHGTGEYEASNGGQSLVSGSAEGGGSSVYWAVGGFGGGGAGHGGCGGGGGGGYSGGDGGRLAGAGGSYNVGTNPSNSAGARTGHGLVTIELL